MLPPQLLSHELLPNNGMRKERKHFLPKYFPVLGIEYSIRVTGIFYHISVDLSIKLENLTKISCFKVIRLQKKTRNFYNSSSFFRLSSSNIQFFNDLNVIELCSVLRVHRKSPKSYAYNAVIGL